MSVVSCHCHCHQPVDCWAAIGCASPTMQVVSDKGVVEVEPLSEEVSWWKLLDSCSYYDALPHLPVNMDGCESPRESFKAVRSAVTTTAVRCLPLCCNNDSLYFPLACRLPHPWRL